MKASSLIVAGIMLFTTPAFSNQVMEVNTYRMAIPAKVTNFDPINSDNPANIEVIKNIHATLVTYRTKKDSDNQSYTDIVPYIADNWTVSADRKTYNFKIKNNVFFHNGRKLSAYDIKLTFERLANPKILKPSFSWIFKDIPLKGLMKYQSDLRNKVKEPDLEGIKVLDEHNFQIILDKPSTLMLKELTLPVFSIIPKEEIDKWGDDFGLEKPIGAGPYSLANKTDDQIILQKNKNHFEKNTDNINTLIYKVVPKLSDEYALFEKHELEQTELPDSEIKELFEKEKFNKFNINVFETNSLNDKRITDIVKEPKLIVSYIGIGTKKFPLKNKNVRQALNYSIDKYKLVTETLKYKAIQATGILPENFPGISNDRKVPYQYNLDKARKMLYQEGFTDFNDDKVLEFKKKPIKFNFVYFQDAESESVANQVASDLKNAGLDIKLTRMTDFNKFLTTIVSGEADFYHFKANSKYADPDKFLTPLFDSKYIGTTNLSAFNNPKVDNMLAKARNIYEDEFRYKFYSEIERNIVDEAPWLFLYQPVKYLKVSPNVMGVQIHPIMQNTTKHAFYGKEKVLTLKK
ncbi:MAG: ABC transporter substrate-binding protein [Candidatus Sericytochromatia bacterium]